MGSLVFSKIVFLNRVCYFKIDLTSTNIISGTCSINKVHRIDGNKEFILE